MQTLGALTFGAMAFVNLIVFGAVMTALFRRTRKHR
jgi:hypothetical protein